MRPVLTNSPALSGWWREGKVGGDWVSLSLILVFNKQPKTNINKLMNRHLFSSQINIETNVKSRLKEESEKCWQSLGIEPRATDISHQCSHHRAMTTKQLSALSQSFYVHCTNGIEIEYFSCTPGSRYVCAIITLLRVDWKHQSIRNKAIQVLFNNSFNASLVIEVYGQPFCITGHPYIESSQSTTILSHYKYSSNPWESNHRDVTLNIVNPIL